VLDATRVAAVLGKLNRNEQKRALEGLALLAKASRQTMSKTDQME
jgi:hypothetical protein